MSKNLNFVKKTKFCQEISILSKNINFVQKYKFCQAIEISSQNRNFVTKSKFYQKKWNFVQKWTGSEIKKFGYVIFFSYAHHFYFGLYGSKLGENITFRALFYTRASLPRSFGLEEMIECRVFIWWFGDWILFTFLLASLFLRLRSVFRYLLAFGCFSACCAAWCLSSLSRMRVYSCSSFWGIIF